MISFLVNVYQNKASDLNGPRMCEVLSYVKARGLWSERHVFHSISLNFCTVFQSKLDGIFCFLPAGVCLKILVLICGSFYGSKIGSSNVNTGERMSEGQQRRSANLGGLGFGTKILPQCSKKKVVLIFLLKSTSVKKTTKKWPFLGGPTILRNSIE